MADVVKNITCEFIFSPTPAGWSACPEYSLAFCYHAFFKPDFVLREKLVHYNPMYPTAQYSLRLFVICMELAGFLGRDIDETTAFFTNKR
jgi:hypothetical protein